MKRILSLAAFVLFSSTAFSQEPPQPPPDGPHMGRPPQERMDGDPIRQLNLTAQQQDEIRSIRAKGREERGEINRQLTESNRLLQEALEADVPDETAIEQRVKAVAQAQAALMRMRILTEVRVRKVLTQEQRTILRNLQRAAQEKRREQRRMESDQRIERRQERIEQRRNSLGPLGPRRNGPPQRPPQP